MIDTADSDNNGHEPYDDLGETRPPTLNASNATKSNKYRDYTQYVMRTLKATRRGIVAVVNWTDAKAGFITALATVIIAVLTGFYVHYSRAQWKVMHDQLPELHTSAQAAKDAAGAAKQSADTQEHSFLMEKRRAEDMEEAICALHSTGTAALDHLYQIFVANSGKVTARNVEAHVDISLNAVPGNKKLRELGTIDISAPELGKDKTLDRRLDLPLTAHDWENIADTKQVIVQSGRIRYENGFERTVSDITCDVWFYFRTPEDKTNPIQGRGTACDQLSQQLAGIQKQKIAAQH
jgi:hypothetical protein